MARTRLFDRLQQAASVAAEAATRNVSTDQVLAEHAQRRLSRRDMLKLAGATGLAAGLSTLSARPAGAAGPRIVVVGAGLAGLTCAYRLKQAGYTATVYEASNRVGGRCWTIDDPNDFAEGQIAEHGGELIDQGHTVIRQLAQELGLTLDNLLAAEVNGTEPFYYFDRQPYTYAQATSDLKAIYQTLHRDVSEASYAAATSDFAPGSTIVSKSASFAASQAPLAGAGPRWTCHKQGLVAGHEQA